jgi:uncharacterized protein (TIGR02246 family)
MSDDEQAIRTLVATWMSASKAGDLVTVLDLMTDDVVFLVPGQKPFGKAEYTAASASMKDMQIEGTSNIQELQIVGNWAYLRNQIEMVVTSPRGDAIRRAGQTLTILQKGLDGKCPATPIS